MYVECQHDIRAKHEAWRGQCARGSVASAERWDERKAAALTRSADLSGAGRTSRADANTQ